MYILFIVLIFIASAILILAVLTQNPKGGMAANFGASNQVMGVRQTADFLEKLTWGLSISIVIFSLCATMAMPKKNIIDSNQQLQNRLIESTTQDQGVTAPFELPQGARPTNEETPTTGDTPTE